MATLTKQKIGSVLAKQGILVAFALFIIAFTFANPKFLSVDNLFSVIRSSAILGIMALGVTFVVISGNLDLSVGSMMSFSICSLVPPSAAHKPAAAMAEAEPTSP